MSGNGLQTALTVVLALIVAGVVLDVVVKRVRKRKKWRRSLRTALRSNDTQAKLSAVHEAVEAGLATSGEDLLEVTEHEGDPEVLDLLADEVAARSWEPSSSREVVALRLWATEHQQERDGWEPTTTGQAPEAELDSAPILPTAEVAAAPAVMVCSLPGATGEDQNEATDTGGSAMDTSTGTPRVVRITSTGGDLDAALDEAERQLFGTPVGPMTEDAVRQAEAAVSGLLAAPVESDEAPVLVEPATDVTEFAETGGAYRFDPFPVVETTPAVDTMPVVDDVPGPKSVTVVDELAVQGPTASDGDEQELAVLPDGVDPIGPTSSEIIAGALLTSAFMHSGDADAELVEVADSTPDPVEVMAAEAPAGPAADVGPAVSHTETVVPETVTACAPDVQSTRVDVPAVAAATPAAAEAVGADEVVGGWSRPDTSAGWLPGAMASTVLVTGAGGPAGVCVIENLKSHGIKVIAGDADSHASGFTLADVATLLPHADDPSFTTAVVTTAQRHKATAVICTVAEEMAALTSGMGLLKRAKIAVWLPTEEAVDVCLDKWAFARRLAENGVPGPLTSQGSIDAIPGPWVVKPRFGRGSRGVHLVDDPLDVAAALRLVPDAVVQEQVQGREFTADTLVDRQGELVACVTRWRDRTKGGISVDGETFKLPGTTDVVQAALGAVGLQGVANVQGFVTPEGATVIVEINPRFSGGLELSLASGADLVMQYLRATCGLEIDPDELVWKAGVSMRRHLHGVLADDEVVG
jgi:carbamoyl-phosphate synthase large subunit